MAKVYEIEGVRPVIDPAAFVHPEAVIIGDVIIGADCYIGPFASLRGDFGRIIVGEGSNVQEGCVLHSFPGKDCHVEYCGHVAHGAILHGCVLKPYAFVGMNAVVMDDAVVGESAMVAAMAFVKAAFIVPDRSLVAGMPAKLVRTLSEEEAGWIAGGPKGYQQLAKRCLASLKPCEPLTQLDSDERRIDPGVDGSEPLHLKRR